jgi:hypothetical protein
VASSALDKEVPLSPRRLGGLLLALFGLVVMVVVPVRTTPSNFAKACGSLVSHPGGREYAPAPRDRRWSARLFEEQRLEGTCGDAARARWLYAGLAAAGLVIAAWRLVRPTPGLASLGALAVVALALVSAAAFDGPPAPVGAAGLGVVLAGRWRRRPGFREPLWSGLFHLSGR